MPLAPADGVDVLRACGLHALAAGQAVTDRVQRWATAGGEVAVKRFDAGQGALAAQEATLIAFLGARPDPRYRVQTLVATRAGAPWVDRDGQRFLVTRWEAGAYRPYDTYSANEWSALGRCLAALHLRLDD